MLAILWILLGSLLFIKPVYAGEPPIQTSPSNGSTVSSSSLNWQAPSYSLYATNPYRVQVDDDSSFPSSSINKDYYTKNTYYSPVLNEGIWYWRVRAKDSSGIWSEWSSVWSFTLQSTPSSPTPALTPTSTPTPTPSSTSSSSTSSSSFTISNIPSQINSNQSFAVSVSLSSPSSPNTNFYLKGAFKKADSANYFGLTKVSGSWVKNGSTYSSQYPITTDSAGNWSGDSEIQPDNEDSGFTGSGNYIFKVARYTSAGAGPTWSNETNIQIIALENTDQGGISSDNSSTTTASSPSPKLEQSARSKTTSSSQSKSYDRLVYHSATVAAAIAKSDLATASANPATSTEVKSSKKTNYFNLVGVLMIISGSLILAFVYLQSRNLTDAILNFFRKRN